MSCGPPSEKYHKHQLRKNPLDCISELMCSWELYANHRVHRHICLKWQTRNLHHKLLSLACILKQTSIFCRQSQLFFAIFLFPFKTVNDNQVNIRKENVQRNQIRRVKTQRTLLSCWLTLRSHLPPCRPFQWCSACSYGTEKENTSMLVRCPISFINFKKAQVKAHTHKRLLYH